MFLIGILAILGFFPHRLTYFYNYAPYKDIVGAAIRMINFVVAIPMSIAFINVSNKTPWTARQGRMTLQYYNYHALIIPPNSAPIMPPLILLANKLGLPMSFGIAAIFTIGITLGLSLVLKIPYISRMTNPSSFFIKKKNVAI